MEVRVFKVLFEKFEEGDLSGYNVTVPELPGCNTWGRTLEDARKMAEEAITGYLEVVREQGLELPGQPAIAEEVEISIPA